MINKLIKVMLFVEKRKSILPLNHPDVVGYLCHAYPLSILKNGENYEYWLYNQYIQLICLHEFPRHDLFTFYLPNYGIKEFVLACPFVRRQIIHLDFVGRDKQTLLEFIVKAVSRGYYVHVIVDEYFVPNTIAYNKDRQPHEMLVIGYDLDEGVLHVAGFDKSMQYGKYTVDYDLFYTAYERCERQHDYHQNYVFLLWNDEKKVYRLRPEIMVEHLRNYVDGKNSMLPYAALADPVDWVYGLKCYDKLLHSLRYHVGELGKDMDVRPIHTVWEHKKIMLKRVQYMMEHGYLARDDAFAGKFKEAERLALTARDQALKYYFTKDKRFLQGIVSGYEDMLSKEEPVIRRLIDELENRTLVPTAEG